MDAVLDDGKGLIINSIASSLGKSGGFFLKNYGCQMNVYDSQVMKSLLKGIGFYEVDDIADADVVVLNTCYIREKASEKIFSELGVIRAIQKRLGRKIITVVTGCVSQAEGGNIIARMPYVDIVLGPQSLHRLPELLVKICREHTKEIVVDFAPEEKFDCLKEELVKTGDVSAFISVQEGCDKFCTFCVVPYTRGAEFSRPMQDIYDEAKALVDSGVREITLLGQNVSAYHGKYLGKEVSLGYLIECISRIDGLDRIRYVTSHPNDMHPELYAVHADNMKVMPFISLPVQSGSDSVLKRMNRKYSRLDYLDIVAKMKQLRSDIEFSSDFIVGFAGESDQDFEDTLDLVKQVGFIHSYSFKYSQRPGTPGAEYKDQVDEVIKSERLTRLQALLYEQQLRYNTSLEGEVVQVLFDKPAKVGESVGRTPHMQLVHVKGDYYGEMINVKILDAGPHALKGEVVDLGCCVSGCC